MRGNDQVRFCEHCDLSVNDLSQMTPPAAIKLALRSKGRLCLRIHRGPSGEIITRSTRPEKLYAISRRASRIAAGAFTAVMGLSSAAYAQSASSRTPQGDRSVASASLSSKAAGDNLWLHGTVKDANGAMIPGANVTIRNERTNETQITTSDGEGAYGVWVSPGESYHVLVESPGFVNVELEHVTAARILEGALDAELDSSEAVNGGAMITMVYLQPLVKAAFEDDVPQIRELLRRGADVNQSENGTTALELAVGHGNLDLVRLLLQSGASVTRTNESGMTILFWLNRSDEHELLQLLLQAGADVNHRNQDGNTALIYAAYADDGEFIRILIDAGAMIDLQNSDGETALMVAAHNGNRETVKMLLAAGANVSLRNVHGQDAMQLAEGNKHEEICALLEAAGAFRTVNRTAPPTSAAADEDRPSDR
jgi:hypothetical protein